MRKIVSVVCTTALCVALLTGCGNTADSVSGSASEENVPSSRQAYSEESSDNESDNLIAEAEKALEQGQYEEAVEKSVKGYLMKEDSTGFEAITLRVAEKLAEEQGFDNPIASKEETFDKKYYEIAIKCDSYKGEDIATLTEEQLIEVYKELNDAFFEPISKSCYMASNQQYLFYLGDIYCNGKWYDVFLGDSAGLGTSVDVISDAEKKQQQTQTTNTTQNAPTSSTTDTSGMNEYSISADVIANGNGKDSYGHDKFDAFVIAENAVKEKLKAPSKAQFCTTTEATIGRNGNTWTVKGWVDAQNGYGAMVRANFVVTFTFASKDTYSVALCTVS